MKNDVKKQFFKKRTALSGNNVAQRANFISKRNGTKTVIWTSIQAHPCAHCFSNIHSEQQFKIHLEKWQKEIKILFLIYHYFKFLFKT